MVELTVNGTGWHSSCSWEDKHVAHLAIVHLVDIQRKFTFAAAQLYQIITDLFGGFAIRHRANTTSTRWHFAFALCCHSSEIRAPIANPHNWQ